MLPRLILGLAVAWCVAFPLVGVGLRFHLFADGGLFAYAVAAGDAWAFHWRQIPVRLAAFAVASWPAEVWGQVTGSPAAGVTLYATLLFLAPAAGLAVTWAADRTGIIRVWAALSTLLLCPIIFGFPTELWVTHAAIWPAMALVWSPGGRARDALTVAVLGVVVLSHEGGVLWAVALLASLLMHPDPRVALRRAVRCIVPGAVVWIGCKVLIATDPYVAEVLGRNALNLFRPASLVAPLVLEIAAALALFCLALGLRRGPWVAFGVAAMALALWWALGDAPLHAWDRYYLRSMILPAAPLLVLLATLDVTGRLRVTASPRLVAAVLLVTLIHATETARFAVVWRDYMAGIRDLASGNQSDPGLGDASFVSSARLPPRFRPLAWHSTTQFLAVLVSDGYAPQRLVVDPQANYFWFDCATATANQAATRALPEPTRAMVRRYTCLHH